MKRILLFLCVVLLISTTVYSKETLTVTSTDQIKIDLPTYISYFESKNRFWSGHTYSFSEIERGKWTDQLENPRSYYRGFWIRFEIYNDTKHEYFGISHENLEESIVYVAHRDTVEKHHYIHKKFSILDSLTGIDLYDNIRIRIPQQSSVVVYSWIESNPFNRWFGVTRPYEQVYVTGWDELEKSILLTIASKLIFVVFS